MTREEAILAAMAAGGPDAEYTPAKIQKLMFIIDREMADHVGGPFFDFGPYHYGPFDAAVYEVLEDLEEKGLVRIDTSGMVRRYFLSVRGYEQGRALLDGCQDKIRSALKTLAEWILPLSFSDLVSAIYQTYPDMKVNSIFREPSD